MAAWYIGSRAEFHDVLASTLELALRRSAASPLRAHAVIVAQLEAMGSWTRNGRTPSLEERGRITVGLVAIRELDQEPVGEDARFLECLLQLAGYFDAWPDDPPA